MKTQQKPTTSNDIQLPSIDLRLQLPSTMSFYGADSVLQNYCSRTLEISSDYSWQHGWCCQERQDIDPILLIQEPVVEPAKQYLVARQDEAQYLRQHGLSASAVGLPFVYAPSLEVKQKPHSLLVMHAHSLQYTEHQWRFDAYVEQIAKISDQFEQVTACIHPSCIEKGYWYPQFEQAGIDCITGSQAYDANGLVRMKTLLNQFEFMTTNCLGSHVAYAAACGVKVSIFGEYAEYREEDFAKSEFYNLHPHTLQPILQLHSESFARRRWPKFFVEPSKASQDTKWGAMQIGAANQISSAEMRKLLGWDPLTQFSARTRKVSRSVMRVPERLVKKTINYVSGAS